MRTADSELRATLPVEKLSQVLLSPHRSALRWSRPRQVPQKVLVLVPQPPGDFCLVLVKELVVPKEILYRRAQTSGTSHLYFLFIFFFFFWLCQERRETAPGAKAPDPEDPCGGVAALQALEGRHLGCHSPAADNLRLYVLSCDWREVAPKSHDPKIHSRFIPLRTLFQPNGEEVRKTNGFFFFHN